MFRYHRKIQFYETDLMGIVHHGNYLRLFEEARVAWAHGRGIISYQKPESAAFLAVLETKVRHLKPLKFGDDIEIEVQVKMDKLRIIFEYKMYCLARHQTPVATSRTEHVSLDENLKVKRLSVELKTVLEKEPWIETWL